MKIDLSIGSPVTVPTFKNQFELEVNYMHGDANAFNQQTEYFLQGDETKLKFALQGLAFMRLKMKGLVTYPTRNQEEELIAKFFDSLGFMIPLNEYGDYESEVNHPEVKEFLDTWMQIDTTDESYEYNAIIDEINLFYYSNEGVKHKVFITADGKLLND